MSTAGLRFRHFRRQGHGFQDESGGLAFDSAAFDSMSRLAKARVEIYGDDSKFQSMVGRFRSGTGRLNAYAQSASRGMIRSAGASTAAFGRLATAAGAATAAFAGAAAVRGGVQTIADFGSEMSKVEALTGAAGEQLDALEAKARELGADTQFSAAQAAAGMAFLAQAGFDANSILAASPGFLNLAAAGGLDLAEAMDIASNVMSGFGLAADQSNRIADVLAKTAGAANTNVSQLGEAFKSAGPVAKSLNIELEQVAAAVGQLGNVGIQGEEAGTALRNIFLRLAAGGSEVEAGLKSLGLRLADVSPSTNSVAEVFGKLQRAVEETGLSADDTTAAFSKIFGTRATAAGASLVRLNADVGELTMKLEGARGAAQKMADTMVNNLKGDALEAKSAIDELVLTIGDAGLESALRSRTQQFTKFTRSLAASGVIEEFAGKLKTVKAALEEVGGPVIERLKSNFGNLATFVESAFGDIDGGQLLGGITSGLADVNKLATRVSDALNPAFDSAGAAAGKIASQLSGTSKVIASIVAQDLKGFFESLNLDQFFRFETLEQAVGSISSAFDTIGKKGVQFIQALETGFHTVRAAFQQGRLGELVLTGLRAGFETAANFAVRTLSEAGVRIKAALQVAVLNGIENGLDIAAGLFTRAAGSIGGTFDQIFANLSTDFRTRFDEVTGRLKDGAESVGKGLKSASAEAIEFGSKLKSGIDGALTGTEPLRSKLAEIAEGARQGFVATFDGVSKLFGASLLDMFANVASAGPSLLAKGIQEALAKLGGTKIGKLLGLEGFEAESLSEIQKQLSTAIGNFAGVDNLRQKAAEDFDQAVSGFGGALAGLADVASKGADAIAAQIEKIRTDTENQISKIREGIGVPQFGAEGSRKAFENLLNEFAPQVPEVEAPQISIPEPDISGLGKITSTFDENLREAALGVREFTTELGNADGLAGAGPGFGLSVDPSIFRDKLDDPALARNFGELARQSDDVESEFGKLRTAVRDTTTDIEGFGSSIESSGASAESSSRSERESGRRKIRLLDREESEWARLDRQSQADIDKAGGRDAFFARQFRGALEGGALDSGFLRRNRITDISHSDLLTRELDKIKESELGYLREKRLADIDGSNLLRDRLGDGAERIAAASRASREQALPATAPGEMSAQLLGPVSQMTAAMRQVASSTAATAKASAAQLAVLEQRLPQETL